MKQFGDYLRQERIGRGITLDAIEKRTRIRMTYLVAIESGEFHRLPGPMYIKAFLRHYARSVGLNETDVLGQYESLNPAEVGPAAPDAQARSERRTRQLRARRRRRYWQWGGVMAIAAAMVAGQLWSNASQRVADRGVSPPAVADAVQPEKQPETPKSHNGSVGTEAAPVGSDSAVVPVTAQQSAVESATDAANSAHHQVLEAAPLALELPTEPAVAASAAQGQAIASQAFVERASMPGKGPIIVPPYLGDPGFSITLEAIGESWIELWIDGNRVLYRNLTAGETVSYYAKSETTFRLGRGENIRLTVNDMALGSVGKGIVDKHFVTFHDSEADPL